MKDPPVQIKAPMAPMAAVPPPLPCPALSAPQVTLVRRNFALVNQHSEIAALVFYQHLFTLDPSLQALFHTSIQVQARKLMEALEFAIATLQNPAELVPVLEAMGRRHVTYGARDGHYAIMLTAMIETLRGILGTEFTQEAENSWRAALSFINDAMLRGAHGVQELLKS